MQLFELFPENKEILRFVIVALTRLSAQDRMSVAIAEQGMHLFMQLITNNIDDTVILALMFELFGQLAFVKNNLKV
jgi:hypothetical protein